MSFVLSPDGTRIDQLGSCPKCYSRASTHGLTDLPEERLRRPTLLLRWMDTDDQSLLNRPDARRELARARLAPAAVAPPCSTPPAEAAEFTISPSTEAVSFVARGVVAATGSNPSWVGQLAFVCEPNLGFYQWDGLHKAKLFPSKKAALAAAADCRGPLFTLPAPESIEAVEREAAMRIEMH